MLVFLHCTVYGSSKRCSFRYMLHRATYISCIAAAPKISKCGGEFQNDEWGYQLQIGFSLLTFGVGDIYRPLRGLFPKFLYTTFYTAYFLTNPKHPQKLSRGTLEAISCTLN